MSPVAGSQTRWQGRRSLTSRCAADWMDTARGAVPSVSQTARGAPPLRGPPSVSARMRLAPGIHACATGTLPGKGLDLGVRDFSHLLTPVAAISPEGVCRQGKIRAEIHRKTKEARRPAFAGPHHE